MGAGVRGSVVELSSACSVLGSLEQQNGRGFRKDHAIVGRKRSWRKVFTDSAQPLVANVVPIQNEPFEVFVA